MELRPVTDLAPPVYPSRPADRLGLGGRLKRLAAGAALALGMAGCFGTNPFINEIDSPGVMEEPVYFDCSLAEPQTPTVIEPAGYYGGYLCGEESAWARIAVDEGVTVTIDLQTSGSGAVARFIAPEGVEAFQLRPEATSATLYLTPGDWTVAVDGVEAGDTSWFGLTFSE